MSENQRSSEESVDDLAWMNTFADLLMLMLTFFVLLLTMSSMDAAKVKAISRSGLQIMDDYSSDRIAVSTTIRPPQIISEEVIEAPPESEIAPKQRQKQTTRDITEQLLIRHDLDGEGWVTRRPDGVEVHIHGDVAFDQGTSRLTARSTSLIRELVGMTRGSGLEMWVETHVDRGDALSASEAGWELALRRTDAVGRYAIRQGADSDLLRLAGYGYSAGRDTQEFLRQSELLSIRFKLPPGAAEADRARQVEELE